MLAMEGRPAETVVASHQTTGRECSIAAAAVNAVMAGCLPEYFPVVVAALEAMDEHDYHFYASTASTGGAAPLLIVAGPIVEAINLNAGVSVFGPGNRANATIGRAIRLIIMNVFEMIPGLSDLSTQGHPGKYGSCIAERADRNPWASLNKEMGYPKSSVTVFAGAGFCNVENQLRHRLPARGSMSRTIVAIPPSKFWIVLPTRWQVSVVLPRGSQSSCFRPSTHGCCH